MKNTNESGRSMVEMLGVLAIIGVLSIGGIAGYTMAMNKYQANEIVNVIMHGAVYCRTKEAAVDNIKDYVDGDTTLLGSIGCTTPATGKITFEFSEDVNNDVKKAVCKTIGIATEAGACPQTLEYTPTS